MIRWIRDWWKADRIRITPGHCRLLQCAVGNRVLVRDRLWRITAKTENVTESEAIVVFSLVEIDEVEPVSVALCVRIATTGLILPAVTWSGPSWREELMEEDVWKFEV